MQRDHPMHTSPHRLCDQIDVFQLVTKGAGLERLTHRSSQELVGVLFRVSLSHQTIRLFGYRGALRHKHRAIVIRVLESEFNVRVAYAPESFDWILNARDLHKRGRQLGKVLVTDLQEQLFLVLEVTVNGGGGVLDLLRDLAHRHAVESFFDEQLSRRVQDLLPGLQLFPLHPLFDAHNTWSLVNDGNLTLLTYDMALSMSRRILLILRKMGPVAMSQGRSAGCVSPGSGRATAFRGDFWTQSSLCLCASVVDPYFPTATVVGAKLHPRKFTCGRPFSAAAGYSMSTTFVSPG